MDWKTLPGAMKGAIITIFLLAGYIFIALVIGVEDPFLYLNLFPNSLLSVVIPQTLENISVETYIGLLGALFLYVVDLLFYILLGALTGHLVDRVLTPNKIPKRNG